MLRSDTTSTEVIASTAFVASTFVTDDSGFTNMRDHSEIVVYFEASSLGSNTEVDIVVFWSDDGSTVPFSETPIHQSDFDLVSDGSGFYNGFPYTAKLTTAGGELVAGQGVTLRFPKAGGACQIGVRGDDSSGAFSVRVQRVTQPYSYRSKNRTDATSTEVQGTIGYGNDLVNWNFSSSIDTSGFDYLIVFWTQNATGTTTRADLAIFWSDDGTTIPFGTEYYQNTDFDIVNQTDGSFQLVPYIAKYEDFINPLPASPTARVFRFPVRGGSARVGVRGDGSGNYFVRAMRIVV